MIQSINQIYFNIIFYYNFSLFQIEKVVYKGHKIIHMSNYESNREIHKHSETTSSQIMTTLHNNIDELMNKILQVQSSFSLQPPPHPQKAHSNQEIAIDCQTKSQGAVGGPLKGKFSKDKNTQFSYSTDSTSCKENAYFHEAISPQEQKFKFFKQKSYTSKKNYEQGQQPMHQNLFSSDQNGNKTNPSIPNATLPKTLSSLFDNNVVKHVKQSNILNQNMPQCCSNYGLLDSTIESMSSSVLQSFPTAHCQALALSDFTLGAQIGSGKYGDVYRCRHKKTGCVFALKKIFKSTIKEYHMQNQLCLQIKLLYKINHPNIIKLYAHFDDQYHVFLLMEYAHGAQLMKKLKSNEEYISRTIDQVIDSVEYIHQNGILHRDIKPENIIMAFQNTVKLCDFGWASIFNQKCMKTTFCGTLDYLSPEMKDLGQYTFTVDIWSVGVLTYELITGQAPFKDKLHGNKKKNSFPARLNRLNWNAVYPNQISGLAETFIRSLLKENPDQRASLKYCKNHIFIKKYRSVESNGQLQGLFQH